MSNLCLLTAPRWSASSRFFPKSHGKPAVDDCRVLSGMIFINRNGLQWGDAPKEYGPGRALYNRLEAPERQRGRHPDHGGPGRWKRRAQDHHDRRDLTQGTPHRVEPVREKGGRGRRIGRTKGGANTKLHARADATGRPIGFFMSAGQVSDYTGAAALLGGLLKAGWLPADRAMTLTGSEKLGKTRGQRPALPAGRLAGKPSNTTSGATNGATASR